MSLLGKKMIDQYRELHEYDHDYGTSSIKYIEEISVFINYLKPRTVLDYGCGKGVLLNELARRFPEIDFYGYDPAIHGRDVLPVQKADMVINTDVLEHIPERDLPEVMKNIASISENVFFALHHALARQILPNGQNAHCTVKPPVWYCRLFSKFFDTVCLLDGQHDLLSTVVTFPVTPGIVVKYYDVLKMPLYDTQINRFIRWVPWRLTRTGKKIRRAFRKSKFIISRTKQKD
jgi:SAM-dependent methyltransferase